MKYCLLLLLVIPNFANAQTDKEIPVLPVDTTTLKVIYSEVIKVDSATTDALYSRAKIAVNTIFKSGKDATQIQDEQAKQIIVKGNIEPVINDGLMLRSFGHIWFSLTIQCKDGRYKYSITDFDHKGFTNKYPMFDAGEITNNKSKYFSKAQWARFINFLNANAIDMVKQIKIAMSDKANSNSQNW